MNDLPYELIAHIGAFLRPKDRCRFYMCTHGWCTCIIDWKIKHVKKFLHVVAEINEFTYMMGMRKSYGIEPMYIYYSSLIMPKDRVNYYKYIKDHNSNCVLIHTPKGCFIDILYNKGTRRSYSNTTCRTYDVIKEINGKLELIEV